ncbi:hypothetical protein V8F20_009607 [Naviculisporaceae sp. PSN 640]
MSESTLVVLHPRLVWWRACFGGRSPISYDTAGIASRPLMSIVNSSEQLRAMESADALVEDVWKLGSLMQDGGQGHVFGMLAVPGPPLTTKAHSSFVVATGQAVTSWDAGRGAIVRPVAICAIKNTAQRSIEPNLDRGIVYRVILYKLWLHEVMVCQHLEVQPARMCIYGGALGWLLSWWWRVQLTLPCVWLNSPTTVRTPQLLCREEPKKRIWQDRWVIRPGDA